MRIGLITPEPGHPLLAATAALLTSGHHVETLDPGTAGAVPAVPEAPEVPEAPQAPEVLEVPEPPADVYLLKSGTPRALAFARGLERRGVPVVNSAAVTALCQDRTAMAERARLAGLPFASTRTFATLAQLSSGPRLNGPVVVKSRHSRKHDLVARLDDDAQLRRLAAAHPQEPVVVQEFARNSGWDHKLWVVGGNLFAALRRSELSPEGRGPTQSLALGDLPPGWPAVVRRVGEVFELDVYGVDIIDTGDGAPLIVDVNAFPGVRGQAGAPEALAALAVSRARRSASGYGG